jgi:hypothetical protein
MHHQLSFKVTHKDFSSRSEAEVLIIHNQLGEKSVAIIKINKVGEQEHDQIEKQNTRI